MPDVIPPTGSTSGALTASVIVTTSVVSTASVSVRLPSAVLSLRGIPIGGSALPVLPSTMAVLSGVALVVEGVG